MSNISNQPSLQDFNHYQLKWLLRLLQLLTWKGHFSIRKNHQFASNLYNSPPEIFQTSLAASHNGQYQPKSCIFFDIQQLLWSHLIHQVSGRSKEVFQHPSSCCRSYHLQLLKQVGWWTDEATGCFNPKAPQGLQSVPGHSALSIARHFQPGEQQKQQRMMRCTFRFIWKVKSKKN